MLFAFHQSSKSMPQLEWWNTRVFHPLAGERTNPGMRPSGRTHPDGDQPGPIATCSSTPACLCREPMMPNRVRAWGLPRGPSMRMRLFTGMPVASPNFSKADRRLDGVAQDRLTGIDITGEHGVDAFAQQCVAEGGIARDPLLHQLLEIPCQGHRLPLSSYRRLASSLVIRPQFLRPPDVPLLALPGAAREQDPPGFRRPARNTPTAPGVARSRGPRLASFSLPVTVFLWHEYGREGIASPGPGPSLRPRPIPSGLPHRVRPVREPRHEPANRPTTRDRVYLSVY